MIGLAGTLLVHGAFIGLLLLGVRPPKALPPVYAVQLVAAPATPQVRKAPEAVERPAEPPPAPVKTRPAKQPAVPTPKPAPVTPPKKKEPAPRAKPTTQTPAPGETPGTGTDVANIKTPGLTFPYPDYLANIVAQIYKRWERPVSAAPLRAEVSFLILKDGTVRDIRFVQRSGNFSFDLGAQGAIEAAGNAQVFGPLPDGYEADVLPVSFFFTPRQR